jgi:hypothetical protein
MIDKSHKAPARPSGSYFRRRKSLPAFTPVPRERTRHDGWTPERQRGFIEALADTGSVKAAAHAVNMTPEGAYLLRRHAQGAGFRKAWEVALSLGVQRLEDVAMDRALNGVEQPVYSYGQLVGTRRVTNDALLMFLLRNRAPHRFAADSLNTLDGATQASLNRLKREWHAEWTKEREAQAAAERAKLPQTPAEIGKSLEARVAGLHTEWVQNMNPETRRYYLAFRLALRAQDKRLSLAELNVDPLAPDFDAAAILGHQPGPPTHIREQTQELGGDYDTPQSYLTPKLEWRADEEEGDEEED